MSAPEPWIRDPDERGGQRWHLPMHAAMVTYFPVGALGCGAPSIVVCSDIVSHEHVAALLAWLATGPQIEPVAGIDDTDPAENLLREVQS